MSDNEIRVAIEPLVYARFWSKVDVTDEGRCWNWRGGKTVGGYGHFIFQRKCQKASRVAFLLIHGYWPRNALHKCDNPPCCNPEHIYDGTPADNMRDWLERGRVKALSGENHPSAVLTNSKVELIRALYAGGHISHSQLAEKFNCGHSTIQRVISRKSWGHV